MIITWVIFQVSVAAEWWSIHSWSLLLCCPCLLEFNLLLHEWEWNPVGATENASIPFCSLLTCEEPGRTLYAFLLATAHGKVKQALDLLKDSCWDGELLTVEQLKSLRCLEKAGKMVRLNSSTLLEGEGEKSSDSLCSRIKLFAQFGCCSWNWTLWVNNFGIVSCCNENSGRKQWVNKCRVVHSWAYGLQHDSFSRQSYLDFLMAKTPKGFLCYLKWDFRMSELTGWLSGMLLVRFVLLASTVLGHFFCQCSALH